MFFNQGARINTEVDEAVEFFAAMPFIAHPLVATA